MVLAVLLAAPAAALARGQPDSPPSPTDAMQTYRTLEGWVRAWRVPPEAQAASAAAAVTLRLDGAVVGRGQQVQPGPRALADAAAQAMAESQTRLPIERDALYDENVRAAAARMTISLELAGPLVPITPESWDAAALELAFGLDGVAARFGEKTAAMFPGAMLAATGGGGGGMDPGRALAACVSKASDDPTLILQKPGEIAKNHGAVYYRFRTSHLAQSAPDAAPHFLHRGGRVVDTRELGETELRMWADTLAENLQRRRSPGDRPALLSGTYNPVSGECETPTGDDASQLVASLALHRYSQTPGVHAQASAAALSCSDALWELVLRTARGGLPPDAPTAALVFVRQGAGVFNTPREGEPLDLLTGLNMGATVVRESFDQDRGFSESVPAGAQGLVALAIASEPLAFSASEAQGQAAISRERGQRLAAAATRAAFAAAPPGQLASQMPWLGWAEMRVCPEAAEIPSSVALREMRRLVWEHQLRPENLSFDQRDLAGGIVFTAARNPLPSWQSARPLAFIATMLGDPRLTDDKEVPGELARLLASLRYLRQLTAGDAEAWMYADPARARAGVRVSLWDQRMPVEAAAMTLMTVCETLRSLDAIKARRANPQAPKP